MEVNGSRFLQAAMIARAESPLPRDFARAERRRRLQGFALVAPLLLFLIFTFLLPICDMLRRSVHDPELAAVWPRTAALLRDWDGEGQLPRAAFDALAADMKSSMAAGNTAIAARRLNYPIHGGRSLVMNTARRLARTDEPPAGDWRAVFFEADEAWAKRDTWVALARASGPVTDFFLLSAVDLRKDAAGRLIAAPSTEAIYLLVLGRTFWIAGLVALMALVLGYPLAYLMTTGSPRVAALLTLFVLLPFWTSLLVHTAAWIVLLQEQGLINKALLALGMIDQPVRLIFNRIGVVITMVHVLLPFMVLPLAAVMRGVKPETVRAARSLGAPPWTAFRRVYFPQTLPGVQAGVLLVFISAIGYYITPALVGGADDQMLASFIAFYTTETVNWGLAAALGVVLLVATGALWAVYARVASAAAIWANT
jgi:putative spermidine/putrescine transport system permease protein